MKPLFFAFLLAVIVLPLRADDWLTNGNFSAGLQSWYGAGTIGDPDADSADPFASSSTTTPTTPNGLTIKLRPDWVKETQDFTAQGTSAVVKLTYVIKQGTTLSTRPEDYSNVPDKIGWDHWKPVDAPAGSGMIFVSNLTTELGTYAYFQPNLQSDKEQVAFLQIDGQTAGTPLTVALAFPPGVGVVTIRSVSVVSR